MSRSTVFRLIRKFKVQRIKVPGDKRTYISGADAKRIFEPEPVEARRRR